MAKSVPAIFLTVMAPLMSITVMSMIDNFEFIDGVIDAMRELKKMGFALVVVTSQSGIARGKFTEAQFETDRVDGLVAGGPRCRSGWYLLCPHHPQGSVERSFASLRLPQTTSGMFFVSTRLFAY